jgi:hypothetical protein
MDRGSRLATEAARSDVGRTFDDVVANSPADLDPA